MAAREEGRAEGEGWLQANVLLGRRHLDGRRERGEGSADGEKDVFYEFCRKKSQNVVKEKQMGEIPGGNFFFIFETKFKKKRANLKKSRNLKRRH